MDTLYKWFIKSTSILLSGDEVKALGPVLAFEEKGSLRYTHPHLAKFCRLQKEGGEHASAVRKVRKDLAIGS